MTPKDLNQELTDNRALEELQEPYLADGGRRRGLRRMNLNLLFALEAILSAPTLTEAARMVSLSQPAMSLSLKKLREHFGDELIIYGKKKRQLTSLAMELRPRVGRIVRQASAIFDFEPEFDPATDTRTFTLGGTEAVEIMYLPRVASSMLREAPGIDVRLITFGGGTVADLFDRGADVAVVPEPLLDPAMPRMRLLEYGLTCLVWNEHPNKGPRMTETEYRASRHAAMLESMDAPSALDRPLPKAMAERDIVVRTEHYAALPNLIVDTDLVVTTSQWLAQYLANYHPLRIIIPPFDAGRVRMYVQWEEHRTEEPMIQWLLRHLRDAVKWAGQVAAED